MRNHIEDHFLAQQKVARYLTTFVSYPLPGCLNELPYPSDFRGNPINPLVLDDHATQTAFVKPRCFHGLETVVLMALSKGVCGSDVILQCPLIDGLTIQCGFMINVSKLIKANPDLKVMLYRELIHASPAAIEYPSPPHSSMPSLMSASSGSKEPASIVESTGSGMAALSKEMVDKKTQGLTVERQVIDLEESESTTGHTEYSIVSNVRKIIDERGHPKLFFTFDRLGNARHSV